MFDIGRIRGYLELEDRFTSTFEAVANNVEAIAGRFKSAGIAMMAVGGILTAGITVPLVAMAKTSMTATADFDAAMTKSLAITQDVSAKMRDEMELTARTVAKTTRFTADQAAAAYFDLISAGLTAEQSMEALPVAAKFAQAGLMDLATASEYLTDAQNALGLRSEDAQQNMLEMVHVSDVLTKANNISAGTIEDFAKAINNKAGAALRMVNKDIEEGTAVLAAYASQGVKAQAAGEKLNIVLRDLQTQAIKHSDSFKQYGIEVFDASGNMNNLADIIGDMEKAFAGLSDEERRAAVMTLGFQDRSVAAMLQLMGFSDRIREYEVALRDAGGETEKVAGKQLQTFWEQLGLLQRRLHDVKLTVGDALAPIGGMFLEVAGKVVTAIEMMAEGFRKLPTWVQTSIVILGALAAAIGPVLVAVGGFLFTLGMALPAFGVMQAGFATLATGFTTLLGFIAPVGATLTALGETVVIFVSGLSLAVAPILAIAAAIAGAIAIWKLWGDEISAWVSSAYTQVVAAFQQLVQWVGNVAEAISTKVSEIGTWISDLGAKVYELAKPFIDAAASVISFFAALGKLVIVTVIIDLFNLLKFSLGFLWETVKTIYGAFESLASFVMTGMAPAFKFVWEVIKGFTGFLMDVVVGALKTAYDAYARLANAIKYIFDTLGAALPKLPATAAAMTVAAASTGALTLEAKNLNIEFNRLKAPIAAVGAGLNQFVPPNLQQRLAETMKALNSLDAETRKNIDAGIKMGMSNEQINKELSVGIPLLDMYRERMKGVASETNKAAEALKSARQEFDDYKASLIPLTENQQMLAKTWLDMGISAQSIAAVLGVGQGAIEKYSEALKESAKVAEFVEEQNKKFAKAGAQHWGDFTEEIEKYTKRQSDAIINNAKKSLNAQGIAEDLMRKRTMSSLEYQLDAVMRWVQTEKNLLDKRAANWQQAADDFDAAGAEKIFALLQETKEFQAALASMAGLVPGLMPFLNEFASTAGDIDDAKTKTTEWLGGLGDLSAAFSDLAEISGGGLDGLLGRIAQIIGLMNVAGEATEVFMQAFQNTDWGSGKSIMQNAPGMITGVIGAYGAMNKATDRMGRGNRALAGAAVGAKIGANPALMMATGGMSVLVGAGVGALVGALRNPAFEDVFNRVGKNWGVTISEQLARSIAKDAKDLFAGNRQVAEIFNIDKIIGEDGGLSAKNLGMFTGKLRDVFALIQQGVMSVADGQEVVEKNWAQFAEAGTDATGRLSDGLREIIQLSRAAGMEIEQITEYLQGQSQVAIEGGNAAIEGLVDPWIKLGDEVKKLEEDFNKARDKYDELAKTAEPGDKKLIDAMYEMLTAADKFEEAQGRVTREAERSATALNDLGVIALSTYSSAVAAGKTHAEALQMSQPGLNNLRLAYEALGIKIEDAGLKYLLMQSSMLEKNPLLIQGISGLGSSLTALANMGVLNTETFSAMQRTAMEMYTRLQGEVSNAAVAAGDFGDQTRNALAPMQDFLHRAEAEAKALGIPLDENTQMLIDQSRELGIWKEVGPSSMELMTTATQTLATVMQQVLDHLRGIPSAAADAGAAIADAFTGGAGAINHADTSLHGFEYGYSPGGLVDIPRLAQAASDSIFRLTSGAVNGFDDSFSALGQLQDLMEDTKFDPKMPVVPGDTATFEGGINSTMPVLIGDIGRLIEQLETKMNYDMHAAQEVRELWNRDPGVNYHMNNQRDVSPNTEVSTQILAPIYLDRRQDPREAVDLLWQQLPGGIRKDKNGVRMAILSVSNEEADS